MPQVAEYLEAGDAFQPVAKVYPLEQARVRARVPGCSCVSSRAESLSVQEALEELGQWHTRGKIVLTLEP